MALAESEKLRGWGVVGRALQKGSGNAQASCSLKERALIELAILRTLWLEAGAILPLQMLNSSTALDFCFLMVGVESEMGYKSKRDFSAMGVVLEHKWYILTNVLLCLRGRKGRVVLDWKEA